MSTPAFLIGKSAAYKRRFTIATAAILLLLLLLVVILPLFSASTQYADNSRTLAERTERYMRLSERLSAETENWQARADAVMGKNYIYRDTSVSASVARLEQYLQTTIREQELEIIRLLPAPPAALSTSTDTQNSLTLLPVSLEVSGPASRLAEFIFILENQAPLLRVDRLEISTTNAPGTPAKVKALLHAFHQGGS